MQISKTLESKKIELSTEIDAVRLLLKDEKFTAKYSDYLHPSLFREQLRPLVDISLKYWKQYRKLCPNQALVQELTYKIGTGFTEEKKNAVMQLLYQISVDPQAPQYTEEQIANFIRFQRLENAVVESLRVLEAADKDRDVSKLDDIAPLVLKASQKLDLTRPSFMLKDLENRTDYRTKLALKEIEFVGFGTGIPKLDDLRMPARGLLPGELGVFIAATGRGKSVALTHCALQAAYKGFPVVYFSLELPEQMLLDRADAMATNTAVNSVIDQRMNVREILMDMQSSGSITEIVFKELPCTGVSVLQIKNELAQLQQNDNFEPRLICVDYMDLLTPMRHTKEGGWKQQQIVTQELKALGMETNCAVWTASQGNRGAANKNDEGDLLTDADVAESYLKLGVTDWAITINRTKAQMKMPEPRPAQLYVVKNRTGIANQSVGILTEFSKMQFYVGEYEPQTAEELADESTKTSAFVKKVKK